MNLDDYKIQRKFLESSIKLAIEQAVEKFRRTTDYCPHEITITMMDVSGDVYGQDMVGWRTKRFAVKNVHAIVEI